MITYPNPTNDYVQLEIDNPDGHHIIVDLFDANGKIVQQLYDGPANFPGKASINFSTHALPQGNYVVHVKVGQKLAGSEVIVKK